MTGERDELPDGPRRAGRRSARRGVGAGGGRIRHRHPGAGGGGGPDRRRGDHRHQAGARGRRGWRRRRRGGRRRASSSARHGPRSARPVARSGRFLPVQLLVFTVVGLSAMLVAYAFALGGDGRLPDLPRDPLHRRLRARLAAADRATSSSRRRTALKALPGLVRGHPRGAAPSRRADRRAGPQAAQRDRAAPDAGRLRDARRSSSTGERSRSGRGDRAGRSREDGTERPGRADTLADAAELARRRPASRRRARRRLDPLEIDPAAAVALGDFYAFAAEALGAARDAAARRREPRTINLWPEHFDIAFEAGAGGARAARQLRRLAGRRGSRRALPLRRARGPPRRGRAVERDRLQRAPSSATPSCSTPTIRRARGARVLRTRFAETRSAPPDAEPAPGRRAGIVATGADRRAHRRRRLPRAERRRSARSSARASTSTGTRSSAFATAGGGRSRATARGADDRVDPRDPAARRDDPRAPRAPTRSSATTGPSGCRETMARPAPRRADRDRRRGHARRRRAAPRRARRPGARRAEDDRQRPRRHRRHLRLRHRPPGRDRGDRPPAHDRRVPPPGDGGRGDGPPRGLDRAPLRPGRRRRRDPDPRAPVRHRARSAG